MRWLVRPEWNWRSSARAPASISTPSAPAATASPAAAANPAVSAPISGVPISIGTSRVSGSGTPDGPHSADWE